MEDLKVFLIVLGNERMLCKNQIPCGYHNQQDQELRK